MALPVAPSQTLFVRNLTDKIPNDQVKMELYFLFSSISPVAEIQARRGKSRGQAWVSFPNIEAATAVLQRFNGFVFLGQPLHIEYAKNRSKSMAEYYDKLREEIDNDGHQEEPVKENITSRILKLTGYPPKYPMLHFKVLLSNMKGFEKIEDQGDHFKVSFIDIESAEAARGRLDGYKVPPSSILSAEFLIE